MALVSRNSQDLEATQALVATQTPGSVLRAGEDLDAAAPCYLDTSDDGSVKMCNGGAAASSVVAGWTPKAYKEGDPVSLFDIGTLFTYDTGGGLTRGQVLYVGATAGRLDDAATSNDDKGCAIAVSSQLIKVTRLGAA